MATREGATAQFGRLAQHLQNAAQSFAAMTAAATGLGRAVNAFRGMEKALTLTAAAAGSTRAEFAAMEDASRDFALVTTSTATENAQALYYLSSAGYSAKESLEALTGTLLLAQATQQSAGASSDLLASTLSAYGEKASETTRVSNVFAASIARSQASLQKLAFSFRQVGPVAASSGLSIEQTTAALSTLYNIGLRGEQAGTSLRNILTGLQAPSLQATAYYKAYGVNLQDKGKPRNPKDVLQELAQQNPSNSVLVSMFGVDGLAGARALLDSTVKQVEILGKDGVPRLVDKWAAMEEQITGTNSAFEQSAAQLTTLDGSLKLARNAVSDLGIEIGKTLAPSLISVAKGVQGFALSWRESSDGIKNFAVTGAIAVGVFIGLTKAGAGFVGTLKQAGGALEFVLDKVSKLHPKLKITTEGLGRLLGSSAKWILLRGAIAGVAGALASVAFHMADIGGLSDKSRQSLEDYANAHKAAAPTFTEIPTTEAIQNATALHEQAAAADERAQGLINEKVALRDKVKQVSDEYERIVQEITNPPTEKAGVKALASVEDVLLRDTFVQVPGLNDSARKRPTVGALPPLGGGIRRGGSLGGDDDGRSSGETPSPLSDKEIRSALEANLLNLADNTGKYGELLERFVGVKYRKETSQMLDLASEEPKPTAELQEAAKELAGLLIGAVPEAERGQLLQRAAEATPPKEVTDSAKWRRDLSVDLVAQGAASALDTYKKEQASSVTAVNSQQEKIDNLREQINLLGPKVAKAEKDLFASYREGLPPYARTAIPSPKDYVPLERPAFPEAKQGPFAAQLEPLGEALNTFQTALYNFTGAEGFRPMPELKQPKYNNPNRGFQDDRILSGTFPAYAPRLSLDAGLTKTFAGILKQLAAAGGVSSSAFDAVLGAARRQPKVQALEVYGPVSAKEVPELAIGPRDAVAVSALAKAFAEEYNKVVDTAGQDLAKRGVSLEKTPEALTTQLFTQTVTEVLGKIAPGGTTPLIDRPISELSTIAAEQARRLTEASRPDTPVERLRAQEFEIAEKYFRELQRVHTEGYKGVMAVNPALASSLPVGQEQVNERNALFMQPFSPSDGEFKGQTLSLADNQRDYIEERKRYLGDRTSPEAMEAYTAEWEKYVKSLPSPEARDKAERTGKDLVAAYLHPLNTVGQYSTNPDVRSLFDSFKSKVEPRAEKEAEIAYAAQGKLSKTFSREEVQRARDIEKLQRESALSVVEAQRAAAEGSPDNFKGQLEAILKAIDLRSSDKVVELQRQLEEAVLSPKIALPQEVAKQLLDQGKATIEQDRQIQIDEAVRKGQETERAHSYAMRDYTDNAYMGESDAKYAALQLSDGNPQDKVAARRQRELDKIFNDAVEAKKDAERAYEAIRDTISDDNEQAIKSVTDSVNAQVAAIDAKRAAEERYADSVAANHRRYMEALDEELAKIEDNARARNSALGGALSAIQREQARNSERNFAVGQELANKSISDLSDAFANFFTEQDFNWHNFYSQFSKDMYKIVLKQSFTTVFSDLTASLLGGAEKAAGDKEGKSGGVDGMSGAPVSFLAKVGQAIFGVPDKEVPPTLGKEAYAQADALSSDCEGPCSGVLKELASPKKPLEDGQAFAESFFKKIPDDQLPWKTEVPSPQAAAQLEEGSGLFATVTSLFGNLKKGISGTVGGLQKALISLLGGAEGGLFSKVKGLFSRLTGGLNSLFSSLLDVVSGGGQSLLAAAVSGGAANGQSGGPLSGIFDLFKSFLGGSQEEDLGTAMPWKWGGDIDLGDAMPWKSGGGFLDKITNSLSGLFGGSGGGGGGLTDMLSGAFGSVMGFFGFADGAAFTQGVQDARLFAKGGGTDLGTLNTLKASGKDILDRPTAFSMKGGDMGVLGEAGPEAIMPLKRAGNKLAVEAADGKLFPITRLPGGRLGIVPDRQFGLGGIFDSLFGGGGGTDLGTLNTLKASGKDILDRPTAFSMKGGDMGVLGEAGPEAIMPLKRAGNKLAVEAADGKLFPITRLPGGRLGIVPDRQFGLGGIFDSLFGGGGGTDLGTAMPWKWGGDIDLGDAMPWKSGGGSMMGGMLGSIAEAGVSALLGGGGGGQEAPTFAGNGRMSYGGTAGGDTYIFNISSPDASGFNRSSNQIFTQVASKIASAKRNS